MQSQSIAPTSETQLEIIDRVYREVGRHVGFDDRTVSKSYTEHSANVVSIGVQQNFTPARALVVLLQFNRGSYLIVVHMVAHGIIEKPELFLEFGGDFYEIAACYLNWLILETQKGQDFGEAARIMQLALDRVFMEHTGTSLVTGKTLPLPDNVRRFPVKAKQ